MPYDRSVFVTRDPEPSIAFDFMTSADDYIADKLFDPKPVKKADTKVAQFDTSKLRLINTLKGTNAEADIVDEQLFYRNITLQEHKASSEVNPRDVRDADIPQLIGDVRKTKLAMQALLNYRESLAVTLATTSGNYMSTLTSAISSGSRMNEAGGDPEQNKTDADTALLNACGMTANAMACSWETLEKIRNGPIFKSRTQYTSGAPVTDEQIKAFFKVQHLFVGKARYDSANEGAAVSTGGFWGTNVIFFVYNPSVALEDASYGHMYMLGNGPVWTEVEVDKSRSGAAGAMRRITVGCEYVLDKGIVESSTSSKFAAGYLFRTAVA